MTKGGSRNEERGVPRNDKKEGGLAMTKRAGVPRNDDEGDPAVTKKATSQ